MIISRLHSALPAIALAGLVSCGGGSVEDDSPSERMTAQSQAAVDGAPIGEAAQPTAAQLVNISTRARVEPADSVLIGGFIVRGTGAKPVLLRALGPSLAAAWIGNALADPELVIYDSSGNVIAINDNWRSNEAQVQATGLAPSNDLESAIVLNLVPGAYTALVHGAAGTTGVALVEAYDLGQNSGARFVNVSSRSLVQTGDNVMIAGVIVGAGAPRRFLIRALGPSLSIGSLGPRGLANPQLAVYNAQRQQIAYSNDWRTAQQAQIVATGLAPRNNLESAVIVTLPPGSYTAIVSGADGGSGIGLVEVYEL